MQFALAVAIGDSFECCNAVSHGAHYLVAMSDGGIRDVLVLELCCINQLFSSCGLDLARMGMVVFW